MPALILAELHRAHAVEAHDAFFLTFDDLDVVGRHLLQGLQRTEVHGADVPVAQGGARGVCGDLAHHGAAYVVGHIAAADDHHAAAQGQGLAHGHRPQELDATVDALCVGPRQGQLPRALGPNGQHHRVVSLSQIPQAAVATDLAARDGLHAQIADDVDLGLDDVPRQPVFGYAHGQHAAEDGLQLVDGHGEAHQGQVVGGGQTGRTGADHAHRATALRGYVPVQQRPQQGQQLFRA